MAELKNHSIRVDDEVWRRIQGLAGTTNDALRNLLDGAATDALDRPRTFEAAFTPEFWQEVFLQAEAAVLPVMNRMEEALELLKSAPQLEDIGTLLGHLLTPQMIIRSTILDNTATEPAEIRQASASNPTGAVITGGSTCKHCGQPFASVTKYATICASCKSVGHTLTPAECPRCTEGAQL